MAARDQQFIYSEGPGKIPRFILPAPMKAVQMSSELNNYRLSRAGTDSACLLSQGNGQISVTFQG